MYVCARACACVCVALLCVRVAMLLRNVVFACFRSLLHITTTSPFSVVCCGFIRSPAHPLPPPPLFSAPLPHTAAVFRFSALNPLSFFVCCFLFFSCQACVYLRLVASLPPRVPFRLLSCWCVSACACVPVRVLPFSFLFSPNHGVRQRYGQNVKQALSLFPLFLLQVFRLFVVAPSHSSSCRGLRAWGGAAHVSWRVCVRNVRLPCKRPHVSP